jgi:hypothetical protein
MLIKITKLAATDHPVFPTAKKEEYKEGQDNGKVSLPVDYYMIGSLVLPIEVGKPILLLRGSRNGIACLGMFSSSLVLKFDGHIAETMNSKYVIEPLTEEDSVVEKAKQERN